MLDSSAINTIQPPVQRDIRPTPPPLAPSPLSQDTLRRVGWEIGAAKAASTFVPLGSHAALAAVSPRQGFAHWRIKQEWIDEVSRERGGAWHNCRMVLRLYDVSYIVFNGFNAHHMQDISLNTVCGQMFFTLARPGSFQLAEAGFLLRSGEFIAAARSRAVQFAREGVSPQSSHAALLVNDKLQREEIGNLWEQEAILSERRKPTLRKPLRIATLTFQARAAGHTGVQADFVAELTAHIHAQGHEVHVFVPQTDALRARCEEAGVHYHPIKAVADASPLATALNFAHAVKSRLDDLPPFDLFHLQEWMTGLAPWLSTRPVLLSLTSLESTRLNGAEPTPLSLEIQKAERDLIRQADAILAPGWLCDKINAESGVGREHIHPFSIEGRSENEWETPLDVGRVKMDFGLGPLDRLLLYVGPLEHAAGIDLLVEALPVVLRRVPNARIAFVGSGSLHGRLQHRAHEQQCAHAVRLLGDMRGPRLSQLLRASEALVLPSRQRVPFDDAVVSLARHAGKAVVTTHGGPASLVGHEQTGIVTYDNPGSLVWALDRILGDPANTERMGANGRISSQQTHNWHDVAKRYLEICAQHLSELTVRT